MRIRHVAGALAAAALIAVTGPGGTAQAQTGELRFHTVGGNQGTVDLPEPYLCYPLGDPEEPAIGGFNATVFTARLYGDGSCTYALPRDIQSGKGFETQGAGSVKFFPSRAA
ncbi:hypothetical protein [Streptomyces marincola]|uniref:hypothetical protein n=1 Tax=Streptomyces marincola TaxID=2878388 RepID=UPI001CF48BAD|nr:hypothetical protein [Streptomyces marincola]UCM86962.1 hypothetical protein LC193_02855 [Streptomyces marincola]